MQLSPATQRGATDLDDGVAVEPADILIVDDLPEKLLVFGAVLEELGQNLVFVRSGREALREVLQREFAVILLDVNMPDIDGFETAELIRQHRKSAHTPIIFITAYADEMQTAKGYALGAVDYILSPVVPQVLRSKVRVFVDLHQMQRRLRRQAEERIALAAARSAQRDAEDSDRRASFLSNASRLLAHSLDLAVGSKTVVDLVVPAMGSLAVLIVDTDEDHHAGQIAVASPAGVRPIDWSGLPAALLPPLRRAIDEQRRVMLSAAELGALDPAAFGLQGVQRFGAAAAVPLIKGDRATGVLLVAADSATTEQQTRDWTALDSLTTRAAFAFENARLYASLQAEIAERTAAQAELQQANQRKDEFLAMLSHELRNPLAPIRNAVEVMRRVAPQDLAKLGWATDVVDRQTQHLTGLVDDLLDVARISQGKIALNRERVDLNAVIGHSVETAQPLIDARRHVLVVEKAPLPIWLNGDFSRLSQVVSNLLHNAAKYSEEGGRIVLRLAAADGQARIVVRDNGIGIDPNLLSHIFELFTQGDRSLDRSQGGLGIGLTLVHRLVELHGGSITASSAGAGKGSEFEVTLPCISVVGEDQRSAAASAPAQAAAKARGSRVLIVDDNQDAAESIALFLELEGHEVKSVSEVMAALASVPVFAPQVVLLDIGLPVLDGYEVARRMRQMPATRDALIVAVSGYGQPEDKQRAKEAGFDHHCVKPADPHVLVELIAEWQREGGAARARSSLGRSA